MSSEGSLSVPQQPVEGDRSKLTTGLPRPDDATVALRVSLEPEHFVYGTAEATRIAQERLAWVDADSVQVRLVAERLAAALGSALGYISADIDSDDPSTDQAWRICQDGKVALQAFESGGATNPGEES